MGVPNGKNAWFTFVGSVSKRWNVTIVVALTLLTCLSFLRLTFVQQQLTVVTRVFASRCRLYAPPNPTEGYCPPSTNVFFLKTHKCASSTVQNILMRYGESRNLSFLLPTKRNYIGNPQKFSLSMISADLTPSFGFNVFCHHTRFDAREIRSALPIDTLFITIMRNPVSLFESMYSYYNARREYERTVEEFAFDAGLQARMSEKRLMGRVGPNQMLFDLGYGTSDWSDPHNIQRLIKEVNSTFNLVMIAELFDESLILLKHKMCWEINDIVYYTHNRRSPSKVQNISAAVHEQLEQYNSEDMVLYRFFRKKLEREIVTFGVERMAREVRELSLWNKVWYDHCVQAIAVSNNITEKENKPFNDDVYGFVLKKGPQVADICTRLAAAELPYTTRLRENQRKLARASNRDGPCL